MLNMLKKYIGYGLIGAFIGGVISVYWYWDFYWSCIIHILVLLLHVLIG